MPRQRVSPAQFVRVVQSLVARELVERMGLPGNRAAALLGVTPSAISQYLSDKRQVGASGAFESRADLHEMVHRVALALVADRTPTGPPVRPLLDAAAALYERSQGPTPPASPPRAARHRALARQLRRRVAAEQTAVTDCMHLAQKSRDELTRAVFRQLAADSLRHAEIAASLATYLDRGVDRTWASGITPEDVRRLMEREHAAEQDVGGSPAGPLGGIMAVLAASMEADERKHTELLGEMLRSGFWPEPAGAPPATGRSRRTVVRGSAADPPTRA